MPYTKSMRTSQPGYILILMDSSSSMADMFGGQKDIRKDQECAKATNRILSETISKCSEDNEYETIIKNRCYFSVIGYGQGVKSAFDGLFENYYVSPQDLAGNCLRIETVKVKVDDGEGGLVEVENEYPVWLEPDARGSTPMAEAFNLAYSYAEQWATKYPNSFPPIVINITDGQPDDMHQAQNSAHKLRGIKTSDGETLLFNIHISSDNAPEVVLPSDASQLPSGDQYAQFLYNLSSPLPEKMLGRASMAGYSVKPGSRAFVYNAKPETLVEVLEIGSEL